MERPEPLVVRHFAHAPLDFPRRANNLVVEWLSRTITDRLPTGCAWTGATDAVVAESFIAGGLLALSGRFLAHGDGIAGDWPAHTRGWPLPLTMLYIAALIAMVPVVYEFVFTGVMFGALRGAS